MLSEQFLALITSVQIAMCEYFWLDVIIPDNPIIPAIWEDGTGTARSLAPRSVAQVAERGGPWRNAGECPKQVSNWMSTAVAKANDIPNRGTIAVLTDFRAANL